MLLYILCATQALLLRSATFSLSEQFSNHISRLTDGALPQAHDSALTRGANPEGLCSVIP
jgi:hypothetical protein